MGGKNIAQCSGQVLLLSHLQCWLLLEFEFALIQKQIHSLNDHNNTTHRTKPRFVFQDFIGKAKVSPFPNVLMCHMLGDVGSA